MSATPFTAKADDARAEVFLPPAGIAWCDEPRRVRTLLGSCVAVCLHDHRRGLGGMCHFILPDTTHANPGAMPEGAFGDRAIRILLTRFKAAGSTPASLEAKLFGGGNVVDGIEAHIGAENAASAEAILARMRINVTSRSLGGPRGRHVLFETATGRAWIRYVERERPKETVVLIGSSTGGTQALSHIIEKLPARMPPVLITQHMPAAFVESFAASLRRLTTLDVRVPYSGEKVEHSTIYLAPGGQHMAVFERTSQLLVRLTDDPPEHSCRPAVDVLFRSAAELKGRKIVAGILTGMGQDGAAGLKSLRDKGAFTFAEAETTCVVFGMPKAAIDLGAACEVAPLGTIPSLLVEKSFT